MAYTAPPGSHIRLNLAGYQPPAGDQLAQDLCGWWPGPDGDNVNFGFGVGRVGDDLWFNFGCGPDPEIGVTVAPAGLVHGQSINQGALAQTAVLQSAALAHSQTLTGSALQDALAVSGLLSGQTLSGSDLLQTHILPPDLLAHDQNLSAGEAEALPEWMRPRGKCRQISAAFDSALPTQARKGFAWDAAQQTYKRDRIGWDDVSDKSKPVRLAHQSLPAKNKKTAIAWDDLCQTEAQTAPGWESLTATDERERIPWDKLTQTDNAKSLPYLAPPPKDEFLKNRWDRFGLHDMQLDALFNFPPPQDRRSLTQWGRKTYREICFRRYEAPAGDQILLNLETALGHVGTHDHINFYFDEMTYDRRCAWQEPSGWRDHWPPVSPITVFPRIVPIKRVYIMINQILCCRLPDRTPFQAFSATISIDLESWGWSFQMTVDAAALALLGVTTAPPEIEIQVNGWTWKALVTGWSESRQFPGGSYNITGISTSAELASPFAPSRTFTEPTLKSAQQLAESELTATGWTIDWDLPSWNVPAGVFSYQNLTPMEAVCRIAKSAGGRVQTDPSDKTLILMPRYPVKPWEWSTASPDLSMTEAAITDLSRTWNPGPCYDGVYVRGVSQGVQALVKRTGTAGSNQAELVADALITDTAPAMSRGIMVLAAGENWSNYQISLPLMPDPSEPGLILPGSLLQVGAWRGQSSGVRIQATRNQGGGTTVRQNIEIERWHE